MANGIMKVRLPGSLSTRCSCSTALLIDTELEVTHEEKDQMFSLWVTAYLWSLSDADQSLLNTNDRLGVLDNRKPAIILLHESSLQNLATISQAPRF
jgi:hypothetical protein